MSNKVTDTRIKNESMIKHQNFFLNSTLNQLVILVLMNKNLRSMLSTDMKCSSDSMFYWTPSNGNDNVNKGSLCVVMSIIVGAECVKQRLVLHHPKNWAQKYPLFDTLA